MPGPRAIRLATAGIRRSREHVAVTAQEPARLALPTQSHGPATSNVARAIGAPRFGTAATPPADRVFNTAPKLVWGRALEFVRLETRSKWAEPARLILQVLGPHGVRLAPAPRLAEPEPRFNPVPATAPAPESAPSVQSALTCRPATRSAAQTATGAT